MAKLLIFRGESLLEERELTGQNLRIGRGSPNDIILEDPGKGVSRNHAEIRFEGGKYTLVDLESQNGVWVSGTRVPFVVLGPDVIATLGPFRLTVKQDVAAAAAVSEPVPEAGLEPVSERTQLSGRTAAPLSLENLGPLPKEPVSPPLPPPPLPPSPSPSLPPPASARVPPAAPVVPPRPKGPQPKAGGPNLMFAGIAAVVLLLAASAVVGYKLKHKQPAPPIWVASVAQSLVDSGKCQEALDTQINPALTADPNNVEAKALKDKCAAPVVPPTPPPPTSTVPPTPTLAERLNEADALIAANDCPKALEMINAVIAEDPNNDSAKGLLAKATACGKTTPVVPVSTDNKPAVALPPAQGGLDPQPGEVEKAYRARIVLMKKKYDDAVALLESQKHLQAKRAFDEIQSQVPSGYRELAQRRDEAISGMRADAKNALEAAQAADRNAVDKGEDFDAATNAYRRVHDLDPSFQADSPIQRLNERRVTVGTKKCDAGRLEFTYNTNPAVAIALLQDAVKLLPQNHPCSVEAKRLLQTKK